MTLLSPVDNLFFMTSRKKKKPIEESLVDDDLDLKTLLNLDKEMFFLGKGYWVKFEARIVEKNEHIPHGIRYSLTLHDANNTRILGYDNAHSPKLPKGRKRYAAKKTAWDHKHECMKVYNYEFESASHLLEDFWADVKGIIDE